MQYTVAGSNGVDCIITRNKGDFKEDAIPCHSPQEFLENFQTRHTPKGKQGCASLCSGGIRDRHNNRRSAPAAGQYLQPSGAHHFQPLPDVRQGYMRLAVIGRIKPGTVVLHGDHAAGCDASGSRREADRCRDSSRA